MRLNYKRADLVICIGDAAQEAAIKTFSIRPEKKVVVRPGIRGRLAESNPGELRRELNIGADEKVVLSVGRITKAKDVEDFGEVARVLSERGKKYRFVFAGYERDESYGRAIKEKYGQHVTFVGHRTDIANLYGDVHLMVHLPHREDSPLVVIEALEFGTACVARNLPGVS